MFSEPLVSIALPVFNAEKTIGAAVQSILNQTYRRWELLIMDDGSTDASLAIVAAWDDPRIKVVAAGCNRGIAYRLNQALDICEGEYFARMDADDICFPQRLAAQVDYMREHPEVDLVGANIIFFQGDGAVQGILPAKQSHEEICRRPWAGFYLAHPTMLGKRDWFRKHRYRSEYNGAEDQNLLFRAYQSSCFACIPEVLLGYRQERRTLKKMLRGRYAFLKAVGCEAMAAKRYDVVVKNAVILLLKVVADILNIQFGVKSLRNPMLPADPLLLQRWHDVWLCSHSSRS
ncbi:glycosyltransferase family 2 protein [Methylomusa anaerophila]|nr:glycosyltransferase [Methylomusa anaerophila]